MTHKLFYSRRAAREYLNIKEGKFAQLLDDGVIPPSIKKTGRHPYWTARLMCLAEKRIDELENPSAPVKKSSRKIFSEKQKAEMRAWDICQRLVEQPRF